MNFNATNKALIREIAIALGELNEKMVYVGGAAVGFYADDTSAEDTRPTKDIDVFLEIASYPKLIKLQENLGTKGFYPEPEGGVMCRFRYKDILLDIMTTEEIGWASADKWFKPGYSSLQQITFDDATINILHVSYFLATKFNALRDRKEDPRTSRHFEDIIYILNNNRDLVAEMLVAPDDVRNYLVQEFRELLKPDFSEAIMSHLNFSEQTERLAQIREKLQKIVEG